MGLAFSSPPYYNLEDYKIGNQSYKIGVTYDVWKMNYLIPTIKNIYKYLINDGFFCINIKNFKHYNLVEDVRIIAENVGFSFITIELLSNI